MKLAHDDIQLRGVEKAAVLFLCMGEERGSEMMKMMSTSEIQAVVHAMSTLGTIPASTVESVIREFSENVSGAAGVQGSIDIAERMLSGFMPDEKISEIMSDLRSPSGSRNVWEDFSTLNEQSIANWLSGEHDQTVAAILTQIKPDVAARVLPLFGDERMAEISVRMIGLKALPRHVLEDLEKIIQSEILTAGMRKSDPDSRQRMAELFNKMDGQVFERLSENLLDRTPQEFAQIKQKMFTFDDLIRLEPAALQRIIRMAEGNVLALALRGAKKDVRDAILAGLTQRMQEMLKTEMRELGTVRARETREAQTKLIDIANELVQQEIIRLPSDEDELLEN
ncbi:flagellar motor switch protein FliG [Sulfitobacter aestuarii]|uniref:Flagellar motor switch protein FliG n=1 Tax=Sulfitobacter aestuarii TaxID=2161676 RepID=A0ABW5U1N8_9RHOB